MKQLLIMLVFLVSTAYTVSAQSSEKTSKAYRSATPVQAKFTCPMHSEVGSAKPGNCSKCGMNLTENNPVSVEAKGYTCPMHTDVISDRQGTCPKCGMKLEQKTSLDKQKKKCTMSCCK